MKRCQIAIIGGGPAGLAAAVECGRSGASTVVMDENSRPGGQLFKQIHKFFGSREHYAGIRGFNIGNELLNQVSQSGSQVWLDSTVSGIFEDNRILVIRKQIDGMEKAITIEADKILIATGGQENAINFEGWTLPGVMGAGCAQTMANVNHALPGKRVLMIGSGNVGLMVSYQMMQAGASIVGVVEAAPGIGGYAVHAAKLSRAGIPFFTKHTVVKAETGKDGTVSRAWIAKVDEHFRPIPGTQRPFDVDTVLIAAGLRPITKLAAMAGAELMFVPELGGWMPRHDRLMQTTKPGVYVAGDIAGVEEASTAMEEGRLAGINIIHSLGLISDGECQKRSCEVKQRLASLRHGPFGEKRFNAKARIEEGGGNG